MAKYEVVVMITTEKCKTVIVEALDTVSAEDIGIKKAVKNMKDWDEQVEGPDAIDIQYVQPKRKKRNNDRSTKKVRRARA